MLGAVFGADRCLNILTKHWAFHLAVLAPQHCEILGVRQGVAIGGHSRGHFSLPARPNLTRLWQTLDSVEVMPCVEACARSGAGSSPQAAPQHRFRAMAAIL